jgi:hypothetical protein
LVVATVVFILVVTVSIRPYFFPNIQNVSEIYGNNVSGMLCVQKGEIQVYENMGT